MILKDNLKDNNENKSIVSGRMNIQNEQIITNREQNSNEKRILISKNIPQNDLKLYKEKEIIDELDKDKIIPFESKGKLDLDKTLEIKELSKPDKNNELTEKNEQSDQIVSLIKNSQQIRNSNSKVVAPTDLMSMKDTKYLKNSEKALKETIKTFISKNIQIVNRIIKKERLERVL